MSARSQSREPRGRHGHTITQLLLAVMEANPGPHQSKASAFPNQGSRAASLQHPLTASSAPPPFLDRLQTGYHKKRKCMLVFLMTTGVLLKPSSFSGKKAPRFPKVTPERDTHGNLNRSISPFADKGPSSQSYGFSSSHAWM